MRVRSIGNSFNMLFCVENKLKAMKDSYYWWNKNMVNYNYNLDKHI